MTNRECVGNAWVLTVSIQARGWLADDGSWCINRSKNQGKGLQALRTVLGVSNTTKNQGKGLRALRTVLGVSIEARIKVKDCELCGRFLVYQIQPRIKVKDCELCELLTVSNTSEMRWSKQTNNKQLRTKSITRSGIKRNCIEWSAVSCGVLPFGLQDVKVISFLERCKNQQK
jgi:hypothetical protein